MEIRILFFIIMLIALWLLLSEKGRKYIDKTAEIWSKTYIGTVTGAL